MIRYIADWIVLRTQERLGIAKCYFLPACWGSSLTLGVIGDLYYGRNMIISLFLTLWLLTAVYFDWQPQWKSEQERADRINMVVTSKFRHSKFFAVLSWLFLLLFLLNLVPPVRALRLIEATIQTLAAVLALANTFPMTGPTLREKLRGLFTVKTATCATESQ